jgi:hypothetical protein
MYTRTAKIKQNHYIQNPYLNILKKCTSRTRYKDKDKDSVSNYLFNFEKGTEDDGQRKTAVAIISDVSA